MISKQCRMIKDWRRVYKDLEETADTCKKRQEELEGEVTSLREELDEVTALRAELAQVQDQLASKEYVLTMKEADVASKERELTVQNAELVRKQEELDRERGELAKARTEIAEATRRSSEMEKVAAETRAALDRSEEVRRYMMTSGVREIVAKIFASDDFVYEVAGLVPKIQTTGRVELLRELQEEYFPGKDIKDLPGYVENAVDISNAAFAEIQKGPKECKILDELAARPEMGVEEIEALQMRKRHRSSEN